MSVNKTLRSIVLASALALGSTGCSSTRIDHSKYNYNGKIGEDQVTFREKYYFIAHDDNILTITKPDGRVIDYMDTFKEDLTLLRRT